MTALRTGQMTDTELKAILDSEIHAAMGFLGGQLSEERAEAMDYYLGEPFGNEADGRSQVISRDVAETIEWIMPSLMRIFTTSDKVVEFEPQGPDDEDQAAQETDYCNYLFYRRNDGFHILYSWFKDALLQKNGYTKVYCEDKEENTREEYRGLTSDEFALLQADPELKPVEHTERMEVVEAMGQQVQIPVHDVVFRRIRKSYDIKIDGVPPEELLISAKTRSPNPKKAPFVCHRRRMTVSDLIKEGYPKSVVEKLPTEDEARTDTESLARRNLTDERIEGRDNVDPAMREIWIYECTLNVDYDGDGVAELRKVIKAGDEILDNEEVDRIHFNSCTPIILPHKHFGLSLHDLVGDLQLIKSTIWRQVLDNLYLINNNMTAADDQNVNLDDLHSRRPGGTVRTKGPPSVSLMAFPVAPLPPEAFGMIEYIDKVKETRTGVGAQFQGLNADTLKDANIPAVQGLVTAAQQRVEMIARLFAEALKGVFVDIHELCRKYPNKPEVVKLRGKWVPVDPRDWRERTNMTVSVGLGSASNEHQMMAISSVINDQQRAVEGGGMGRILTEKNIYAALKRKAQISGFQNADEFWTDPATLPPPPPPPPDPSIQVAQADIQSRMQIEGQKRQNEQMDIGYKHQVDMLKLQFTQSDAQAKDELARIDQQIEILKVGEKSKSAEDKHAIQAQGHDMKAQMQALQLSISEIQSQRQQALEKYKADLNALMDHHIAQMNSVTKLAHSGMNIESAQTMKAADLHSRVQQKRTSVTSEQ